MTKLNLKLGKQKVGEYSKEGHYENNYKFWRQYRKNANEKFFMVPSEIIKYVSSIKSKAMNLYLYYSYRANNDSGKSWASVERAAEDLCISTKSVNNWNKELESLGLIARINEGKSSKTTYLLPITDYYYFEKNTTPENFIEFSDPVLDGDLMSIFHLFQWRKENSEEFTKPYNLTCLIFKRSYEPQEANNNNKFMVIKAVIFEEKEFKKIRIDKTAKEFPSNQDAYLFESPKRSYAKDVETIGVAITTKINLKDEKNQTDVLDLIQQLVQGFDDGTLHELPKVEISEDDIK